MAQLCGSRPSSQLEFRQQRLAEMAPCALGKDRVLGMQLHAELKVLGGLAVLADPQVAGGDALHRTVVVVEHFGGCKTGKDLDAQRLGLLRHPAHHVAEPNDVIALVVHRQGHEPVGRAERAFLGEKEDVVARHGLGQRCAELLPVRDQLGDRARVHHRARKNVCAGLGAFLEQANRDLLALLGCELLQADRGRKPCRPRAHDDDVVLHRLARAVLGRNLLRAHGCSFVRERKLAAILRAPRRRSASRMQYARCWKARRSSCYLDCAKHRRTHELQHRSFRTRGAGHRRVERARDAIREDAGEGRRGGRARRPPRRAAEDAARRDRGRRRKCACRADRRDRSRRASSPLSHTPRPRWERSTS